MKKIVIIGGGFTGTYTARHLQHLFNVTLIDTKDYFEFTPGILRTLIEPEHARKIQAPHKKYLSKTAIIKGTVTDITSTHAIITNKKIPYDYLIIASGSTYNTPIKAKDIILSTRATILKKYATRLEQSQKILIIGGGIVGVELAAEIITAHPQKNVTIIHSGNQLLQRQPEKARRYAEEFLTKKGVTLAFNQRAIKYTQKTVTTSQQKKYFGDLTFLCTGITPNSAFLKKHFKEHLTDKKQIITTEQLNLPHHPHIFVGGDATSIHEEKTAQNAEEHAKIIIKNILNHEANRTLKKYVSKPRIMIISLGKNSGILTYKQFTLTGKIPGLLKQFVEKKRNAAVFLTTTK